MELKEKLELLGRAFAYGEIDELAGHLYDECKYNSDYAHKRFTSAEQILDNMRKVNSAIQNDKERDSTYSYSIVKLNTLLKEGVDLSDLHGESFFDVYEDGLLLYQFGDPAPVAVVYIKITPGGSISEINLSRNHKWFSIAFYGENGLEDSEKDLPYTVKPMSPHDRQVKEMQAVWTHQKHEYEELDDTEVYIWRQADKYLLQWLSDNGYQLMEKQIYDDCIGYRCHRKGYAYTIYMFAYGQVKTAQLDGDYCKKLLDYQLSENSLTLVVYLNVKRSKSGEKFKYTVCDYSGNEDRSPELWLVKQVNEKWILDYFPRKEMIDAEYRLMYAFNRDNMDVYDCIITEKNPAFNGLDHPGSFMNEAFYLNMFRLHKEHGDMKIGYVRFNDVIYSSVPYIGGYGYFSFRVDNATDKILEVTAYAFDGEGKKYAEFIKTDERESDGWYGNVPQITGIEVLPPVTTERFAMKLFFDNGECRKYILPIASKNELDEVVSYKEHVFTDKIWNTAHITQSADPHRGLVIEFSNEFFLSALKCYEESESYTEPVLCCDETVFEDNAMRVKRLWTWKAKSVYEDEETGLMKTLLTGQAFNYYGVSTFASREGKRLCSISFDYVDNFHEGLAKVAKDGFGYGFIDKDMRFVIPMRYNNAEQFSNGKAKVKRGEQWFYIDKNGKETPIEPTASENKYQDIGEYSEGMCRVSTLKLGFMDLAYHSDYSEIAGTWGFVDENGVEVISPQYIYAQDFSGGIAIVCKGKWTRDKKWDNKYNSGRYWTEEELWGAIDKSGKTVIPFIFDEIKYFSDTEDVFMAHVGGWENGHWGVIDKQGNWLADPIFADIDYEYHDGLFAFYESDKWDDDVPLGIYDVHQKKVLFQPQFFDVSFRDDGWIEVEVYDEQLGRRVEKLIDRSGKEKFHSIYTSIYCWKKPYEVMIRDENGDRHGLIDENGNVILPCEYDVAWSGIDYEHKRIVFKENEKYGVKDFDGNTLVAPLYHEIHGVDKPLITVRVGEKDNYKEGLITQKGIQVVPAGFSRISWCKDGYIICCADYHCEMLLFTEK